MRNTALPELVILRNLLNIAISDAGANNPDMAVEAELRYARVHILSAIRHQAAQIQSEVA